MKKSILLIAAGLIAGIANGQEARSSFIFQPSNYVGNQVAAQGALPANLSAPEAASKTTSWPGTGGNRWYDYGGQTLLAGGVLNNYGLPSVSRGGITLWNDTTALMGYTGTPSYGSTGRFVSVGLGFDPRNPVWNDGGNFPGVIAISAADAYTIDSVMVIGWYDRNLSKPGVVDTMIVTFISGNGTSTAYNPGYSFSDPTLLSHYGITSGGLNFLSLGHDSLNNRAGNVVTVGTTTTTNPVLAGQVIKFPLRIVDTNGSNCNSGTQYPRPATGHPAEPTFSFAVPAGSFAGVSATFKSGDTWPATIGPSGYKDTVRYSNGTTITGYKYGCFTMAYDYVGTSTTAAFPPYMWPGDHTSGHFSQIFDAGWAGLYIPNWAWSTASGTAASELQYPTIVIHAKCTTCNLTGNPALGVSNVSNISNVSVYPNPASSELNISFNAKSTVSVTLTNMVGQVVASQNVTNGHTTINTSALPAGMYVYTLSANGERTTGRVVVAH